MAKATELRALNAALIQGRRRHRRRAEIASWGLATYEEEPSPACHHIRSKTHPFLENLTRIGLGTEEEDLFHDWKATEFSSVFREDEILPTAVGRKSYPVGSCSNHGVLQEASLGTDATKTAERTDSEDRKVLSICNKCKPAAINGVQGINSHQPSFQMHPNHRGVISWLFPRFKRKPKLETCVQEPGAPSLVSFKKELIEASENRDSAFSEVGEMRSSLTELKQQLGHLEAGKTGRAARPDDEKDDAAEKPGAVSHEVMLEGFLQMVSEARLSVKQLCRSLMTQIEEAGTDIMEKIDFPARSNHLTFNPGYSRELGYHLQARVNRTFYQDFENCVFQKNGSQRILDPGKNTWRTSRRGSQPYLADLARFCEHKMACLVALLDSSSPRREHLRESFFVAAKCIWLLHLLAFSFSPPLAILRVEEKRRFDQVYMEDVLSDKERPRAPPGRVKVMVTPGFYVHERVVRCKVLCSRSSAV
ncbi:unnamed protein product [Spirodela intermedia]|uniref:GIL1/IRKI C-terminal domain-containing protein n=1 Tax=Spirodela intermedia TaxID=51605 RepID=A0A7I8JL48_SPIIN|nr:unnamed protein product [Spirodela intermedia]CAA6670884.1 unnamed protein product [Spirodela intermedia]